MSGRRKKELWENLAVVWKNESPEWPAWFLTTVINHNASDDPSAPKYVTHSELMDSVLLRDRFIEADSKEEAMLKYAASGRASGPVWSIDKSVARIPDGSYRLVREEMF